MHRHIAAVLGLRDYGVGGQIGLESSPEHYVATLVDVFASARRVLRDDGTLWLNLGDSYAANRTYQVPQVKRGGPESAEAGAAGGRSSEVPKGLKPKDLVGIPWRVAFALQADGWYLRQDIIWAKPNPMPESVTDRCTKAHEYIFLLAKRDRYYYNSDAILEDAAWAYWGEQTIVKGNPGTVSWMEGRGQSKREQDGKRNKRSVWTVTTQPFKDAHFATFPPDLIEPCILAGCPEGGTVLDPFGGAGTTGLVADRHGRNAILIELNPEYAAMAERRIYNDAPLFADVSGVTPPPAPASSAAHSELK